MQKVVLRTFRHAIPKIGEISRDKTSNIICSIWVSDVEKFSQQNIAKHVEKSSKIEI